MYICILYIIAYIYTIYIYVYTHGCINVYTHMCVCIYIIYIMSLQKKEYQLSQLSAYISIFFFFIKMFPL